MRQELNGFSNLEITATEQKVAFIFSNVVGTVTRGDLSHQSDGAVSCGFCTVYQCTCAFVPVWGKPGRVPECHCFPNAHDHPSASNLNERRIHFSKITAAAPGSLCFQWRVEAAVRVSSTTKLNPHR